MAVILSLPQCVKVAISKLETYQLLTQDGRHIYNKNLYNICKYGESSLRIPHLVISSCAVNVQPPVVNRSSHLTVVYLTAEI